MRSPTSATILLCALVGAMFCSGNAMADEAMDAYSEGVVAFEAGKFGEAADAFRKAYNAKPAWKVRYNIGQSEAAAKRLGSALESFEAYLSEGGDDVSAERREEVIAEIDRLRKLVGSIEIKAPAGANIFVDGVLRGTAPLPGKIPVTASVVHEVHGELDDVEFARKTVKVRGLDNMSVELVNASLPSEDRPAVGSEAGEDGASSLAIAGWVTLGVGAAALIGGSVTGGLALAQSSELEDSPDCAGNECYSSRAGDIDKMDNLALGSNILLGVGGAAAVVGFAMIMVDARRENAGAPVALRPAVGTGFAGAVLEGRF